MPESANPSPEKSTGSSGRSAGTGFSRRHRTGTGGLRPSPPPLEVNTFFLVAVGEALWLLAFLVLLPFRDGRGLELQTCAAGFLLGLLGLFLSRNRRG